MAKGENLDYKVTIGINSKQFNAEITKCNKETREFKRQQKEAFKQAGESATSGFGKAIAAAKKLAPALSAGAAAFAVVQRAFQSNNYLFDEWERSLAAAQASFTAFASRLANADFSNFIDNMADVISSAREAASALQDLDDAKMFGRKAQAEIDYETEGYYSILKNRNASKADVEAAMKGLAELRNRQENVKLDEASANLNALASRFAEIISSQGVGASASNFIRQGADGRFELIENTLFDKIFSDWGSFQAAQMRFERFKDDVSTLINWQKVGYVTDKETGETIDMSEYKTLRAIFKGVTGEKMQELFNYYQDALAGLTAVRRSRNQDMRIMGRWENGGYGGTGKSATVYPEGSISYINQQLAEARTQFEVATTDAAREVARKLVMELENELDRAQTFRRASGIESIGNLPGLQATGLKPLTLDPNVIRRAQGQPATDTSKDLANASEIAINGIELVTDTMRQLGITSEIADEGLRKTLSVLGNALAIVGNSIGGVWGKGLTALGGIIGSFEGGGIVGGTSYTGDHLTAKVNSKEMWLSTSQQSRLLSMINGGGGSGGGSYNAMLTGENLYFALRNYGRRTGKLLLP